MIWTIILIVIFLCLLSGAASLLLIALMNGVFDRDKEKPIKPQHYSR